MNAHQIINSCYSGRSKIRCRNCITNKIIDVPASEVTPDIHEVYSADYQNFIPIMYNIVAGITNKFVLIKKNTISENQPYEDFYVASKHHLFVNGSEVLAKKFHMPKESKLNLKYCIRFVPKIVNQ